MSLYSSQDYISHVRAIIGKSPDYVLTDSMLLQLVDRKIMKYIIEYPFYQFDQVLVFDNGSATSEVTTGYNVLLIKELTNVTTGTKMIRMDRKDYNIYTQGGINPGPPTHWFVSAHDTYGTTFSITYYPTPDQTYTFSVVIRVAPDPLVTTPAPNYGPLSAIWDEAIIMGTAADVFSYVGGDQAKAAQFYQLESAAAVRAANFEFLPTTISSRSGITVKAGIKS